LRVGRGDGPVVPVGLGRREAGVVAVLALARGRVVPAGRLIEELWPEHPPDGAQNTVQVYVSRIRRALGRDAVRSGPGGYSLDVVPEDVDVTVLEDLAAEGAKALAGGRFAEAARVLGDGVAMWAGDGLAGVTGGMSQIASVEAEAVRLGELRLAMIEDRLEAEVALGRGPFLVPEVQALLEAHPFRERLHATLMTALFQAGRQVEALDHFTGYRARCVEELGLEPGVGLQGLQREILAGGEGLAVVVAPTGPLFKDADPNATLPRPRTRLVGRDGELAELADLLGRSSARLVTLTGPGGSGKTRLGIEVARTVAPGFGDGVFFVGLAEARDADQMWTGISGPLNVPPEARVPPGLFRHLAERSALFVLDNLEQIDQADRVVGELLSAAPGVVVLATSRVRLRLDGEFEHPVPPLELPGGTGIEDAERFGAVQLFVDRARMARPGFQLGPDNMTVVVKLCRQLDGLPLAIELAAARLRVLGPQALVARLGQALDFKDVIGDRPERQHTMRATIAWSYQLLTEPQQALLRHLSVFAGGADLAAVAAVALPGHDEPEVLDRLGELADASMITLTEDPDGEPRISMLETVRHYARTELQHHEEARDVRHRHARHFLDLSKELESGTEYGDLRHLRHARRRFEVELGNMREALGYALGVDGQPDIGQALCANLAGPWRFGGYLTEARRWLEIATSLAGDGHPNELGRCLAALAWVLHFQGQYASAHRAAVRGVEILRETADESELARALTVLGRVEMDRGDDAAARQAFDESARHGGSADDPKGRIWNLRTLGVLEAAAGDLERAGVVNAEAIGICDDVGDEWGSVEIRWNMACVLRAQGRLLQARRMFEEQIPVYLGWETSAAPIEYLEITAEDYGACLAELGEHERAVVLLGASDAMRSRDGTPRNPAQAADLETPFAKTRAALSPDAWEAAYQTGQAMTVEDALMRAL
jgi:predicted ATPase/DNA-binding SARP family transcriptional activator